jgi:hypothetical protein
MLLTKPLCYIEVLRNEVEQVQARISKVRMEKDVLTQDIVLERLVNYLII